MITPAQVIALDEVAEDLNEGQRFYRAKETWLGDYFWDSVMSDMESLYVFAGIHELHFGYHRLLSKRFPYGLYYDIDGAIIRVVAVLPMRRNPAWIRARLKSRG